MIATRPPLLRNFGRTALLAGIFATASAFATPQVATPSFSPAGGIYFSAQLVAINSTTGGASVAYTTDGSIPTESGGTVTHGALYSGAVSINPAATLSAIAFESGYLDSGVCIEGYTLQAAINPAGEIYASELSANITPAIAQVTTAPIFSPAAGTYESAQSVTISSTTSGA